MSAPDQLEKLNRLITALVPDNRFYTAKLQQAGLAAGVASLTEFFQRMPLTTKAELVEDHRAHPPYGSNLTYPLTRYTRFNQTSGTTGEPLRWLDTNESWSWMLDCWEMVFRAAGAQPADHAYFAFSFGPFLGFWTAFESAARRGMLCIPGGGLSSVARLHAILDNNASVLCCTPTYALHLGEAARQAGIDLVRGPVKTIIVAGEPGGSIPTTRARVAELWPGARMFDHHGMTEVGPVTYECPEHPGTLCVIETAYIAEIIDPQTGREVAEGETGELLLTNLGRTGSPLLRYRTGDLVKKRQVRTAMAEQPVVGLEGGILGRVDDMIIVRGVNIYPTAMERIVRRYPEIVEFRTEVTQQHAMDELRLVIEPAADCANPAGLAKRLEADFRDAFALRIPVVIAPKGSLPRFDLKAKRWIKV